jgi:ribosomal protein L7Ae-like RNA K-turn-binding protein
VECQARILAKPGPLYRAFRTRALTTDGLTTALIDEANQTLSSLLDRAWRSGQLVLGTAAITKAKSTPPIDVLLFAADAGSKTSTLLKQPHPTADTFSLNLDKCALGAHFRKGPRAAVGVVQGPFSPQICRELRRITALR